MTLVRDPAIRETRGSLAAYGVVAKSKITVPTKSLPPGDYELIARVEDAAGVRSTMRWTLRLASTSPLVSFEGLQDTLSASKGGMVRMWIDAGQSNAGARYIVLLSATPSVTGSKVLGIQLPIRFDGFGLSALSWLGTPLLPDGIGSLDQYGTAKSTFVLPPAVATGLIGQSIWCAPIVAGPTARSSGAPAEIRFVK